MAKKKNKPHPIPAAEFKAKCLRVMETVRVTGEEFVITRHGAPVAKLVPVVSQDTPLYGRLAGTTVHEGDLISPIGEPWEADHG